MLINVLIRDTYLKFTSLSNKMAAFDVPRFNEKSEYRTQLPDVRAHNGAAGNLTSRQRGSVTEWIRRVINSRTGH